MNNATQGDGERGGSGVRIATFAFLGPFFMVLRREYFKASALPTPSFYELRKLLYVSMRV